MTNESIKKIAIVAVGLLFVGLAGAEVWNLATPVATEASIPLPETPPAPAVTTPPAKTPTVANNNAPDPNYQRNNAQQAPQRQQFNGQVTVQQQTDPNGRNVVTLNNGNQNYRVPLPQGVQVQQQTDANGNPGAVSVQLGNGRNFTVNQPGQNNGRGGRGGGRGGRGGGRGGGNGTGNGAGGATGADQPVDDQTVTEPDPNMDGQQ